MIGAMIATLLAGATAQAYDVRVEMRQDDRVIATPRITVREGRPASIELTNQFKFAIVVAVDGERPGGLLLSPDLTVVDAENRRRVTTTVAVRPGEEVSLTVPAMDNAPATAIDVRMSVTPIAG